MKTFLMVLLESVVSRVERCFPLLPSLDKESVGMYWQAPEVYYFLDDPSPRLRQRCAALLRFDRNAVSFWRKRQQERKLAGWRTIEIHQHVS